MAAAMSVTEYDALLLGDAVVEAPSTAEPGRSARAATIGL